MLLGLIWPFPSTTGVFSVSSEFPADLLDTGVEVSWGFLPVESASAVSARRFLFRRFLSLRALARVRGSYSVSEGTMALFGVPGRLRERFVPRLVWTTHFCTFRTALPLVDRLVLEHREGGSPPAPAPGTAPESKSALVRTIDLPL